MYGYQNVKVMYNTMKELHFYEAERNILFNRLIKHGIKKYTVSMLQLDIIWNSLVSLDTFHCFRHYIRLLQIVQLPAHKGLY